MPCIVDCGRMWWWYELTCLSTTPHATLVLFSLEAHQLYIFFSLHSFSFILIIFIFFIETQNFKSKKIQLKYLKVLKFKNPRTNI